MGLVKIAIVLLLAVLILGTVTALPAEAAPRKKITISDEEAAIVRGKIMRPELSVILQRSKFNYEALKEKKSFLNEVVDSIKQDLF